VPTYSATARIAAAPREIFNRLDDQEKLAAHMTRNSAMMGGGRMIYEFDALAGRAVGSHIRMGGDAFGVRLFMDEVVTVREPPRRKAWATTGDVRLLVLSGYRMGFDVEPAGPGSDLTVWIDYDLPRNPFVGLAVAPMAKLYARWCVDRMMADARGALTR
jgi:Polyketide cyclase / dehydrase and lipid transport